ncbi:MAG TPA: phosphoenolpyruvate carboxykinase (ATP) [Deltaproteobacteria bacterium]|nr:phosphoenolpyruvate carboxykinase (ATP) [Deltaproteobacteria bacterium]
MLDLTFLGRNLGRIYRNLSTPALYEEAVRRSEGWISHAGPLVVRTGQYTGRSAEDKFVVREPSSEADIWWGKYNRPIEPSHFRQVLVRLQAYLQGRDIFVQDCYAGADPDYRLRLRVVTETAWHSLFARNMFIQEHDRTALEAFVPDFRVIHCPQFQAIPEVDHTRSEAFILLDLGARLVIIGGTSYAGEIKKSVFTTMNYLLPKRGVLGMHCSANQGPKGDTAIFFGLSGTGKTTLSADPERALIGDDEHGWIEQGIFNFEGGCYAKVIRLSPEAEPEIYEVTRRFGTVLENVAIDPETRRVDLNDDSLTENTRAAYHVTQLPKIVEGGVGGHPRNIIMLTADAFGVMPPIAKLNPAQAMYHFLSGYTAKLAGTERGVKEPTATFSPLFGAPFMALHPMVYADLFGQFVARHKVDCWLVNTGWTGGPYGEGNRLAIAHSRAVVRAALSGALSGASFETDPVFGFGVPRSCPGVPAAILSPRGTWSDTAAYDRQARALAERFSENFAQFADRASPEVRAAGPARV